MIASSGLFPIFKSIQSHTGGNQVILDLYQGVLNYYKNNLEKKEKMSNQTIYVSKRQLRILAISLMSLTRDTNAYDLGLEMGAFKDEDIHDYILTINNLIKTIPTDESGVLIVSELGKEITSDCIDLWGNAVGNENN